MKQKLLLVLGAVALVGGTTGGALFYQKYQKLQTEVKRLQNPTEAAKSELSQLTMTLSKHMLLPQGETPTVATVTDKEKLGEQPFFANTQNGDKLVIYTQAKKAILYRPSTDKVIEVAPVNIGQSPTQVAGATTQNTFKFIVANGSGVTGATKSISDLVTKSITSSEIVNRVNAAKSDYEKSLLVDIAGNKKDIAAQIAKALNIEVGDLPASETKSDTADFLIIVGRDKVATPTASPK